MRIKFAFIAVLCIITTLSFAQNDKYKFRRINISDGLSNNQVRSILVDKNGFAWFGTISGLNRYDGYSFKIYKNNPSDSTSIAFNSIYKIKEDYQGKLWLFAAQNIVSIYDPKLDVFSSNHEIFSLNPKINKEFISELLVDNDSNMWLSNSVNGIYVYNISTNTINQISHLASDANTIQINSILDIAKESSGDIWAINSSMQLEKIDHKTLKVKERISINPQFRANENQSLSVFVDKDDDLWVFSPSDATGLYFYSQSQRKIIRFHSVLGAYKLNSDIITGIEQDDKGVIWVATDHGGINLINKRNFKIEILQSEEGVESSLCQNSVTNIYKDQSGIIWIGSFKSGLNFFHPKLFQFGLVKHFPFRNNGLPANDIDCFAEDAKGNLWIGTNGNGLIYYDKVSASFKVFKHDANNQNSLSNDIIVGLCTDHLNRLWIGTYYGGLNVYDGTRFIRYMHDPNNAESISDNRIWQIMEDSRNRIWIGTLGGGLDMFDSQTQRFLHFKSGDLNSIHSDFVLALAEDKDGLLWFGTAQGVDVLDPKTGRFTYYCHNESDLQSLCNDVVLSICEDKRGWIWLGTRNGLSCLDKKTQKFKNFNVADGLPDNNILSVLEDENGNIWVSTLNGLSNLKVIGTGEITSCTFQFRNYDVMDGLQGKEFNEHSGYKTRSGQLLFGGANGYNSFRPQDINEDIAVPDVVLTDFRLHNRSVNIGEELNGRVILEKAIFEKKEVVLKHNQNVFSIEFSALNYLTPEKMQFKYMLEGFNNEWIATDVSNRHATFTNLNPGEYIFKIIASNGGDSKWSDEKRLKIIVIPPFYASKLAFVLYAAALLAIILLLIRTITRREQLKYSREHERMQHQRMHDLDNMKIRFFTNISHEFRTPLTLILTPLEKLIKTSTNDDVRNQLIVIQRNGKRLLNLVNKLLDFRKMEVKNISINYSFGNIIRFIEETVESFSDLSEAKSIRLTFSSTIDELFTYFDHDKIEKVLFNLLSNAFKFTPPNGLITVTVDCFNQNEFAHNTLFDGKAYLEFRVSDTGIGISKDKQEAVFERFFQSENTGAVVNQGSGIGLALVQEFVRLHKGTIHVDSELDSGSTFIVRLPLVADEIVAVTQDVSDQQKLKDVEPNASIDDGEDFRFDSEIADQKGLDQATILIVEDNEDLRFYLKENLKSLYHIIEAENGQIGWEKVKSHNPSLIVSDIMMPEMDGIELCSRVKSNAQTSHIPIILLSARSANEQKIEGLEAGADDYVTKPFNYKLLEIKIQKLISQRQHLHKSLHLQYEIKSGEIGVTSLDEKFITKALSLVEQNLADSDFSVEKLSKEMGVSRGHLYNKLLALTGKTPIEFIRIMRLKRAAQLLGKSQLNVSEIAFDVGFNDPKYFSKYFKEEFGQSPSEYAKKAMRT